MVYEVTSHKVAHRFEVEIRRDNESDAEQRYKACCVELSGCTIHPSSKTKALRKIRQAIDVWLYLANRRLGDEEDLGIEDMIWWSKERG